MREKADAGLYIHVPFCVKKCPYCDFFSSTDLSGMGEFSRALIREMETRRNPARFDTLYIGGGTPSLLKPAFLEAVRDSVFKIFRMDPDAEITMEINPGTVDFERLTFFKSLGVNRLSVGVQSFSDDILKFLGRIHTAADAEKTIEWARAAGFENISLDLIYGIPGQTPAGWLQTLEHAAKREPSHLSCYTLTYEAGTKMEARRQKGVFRPLSEKIVTRMCKTGVRRLERLGFSRYEISSFSRPGRMSRHNIKYWSGAPYVGLGPSAHSYAGGERSWNPKSLGRYLRDLRQGRAPAAGKERLTQAQKMTEFFYLALRQSRGIDVHAFKRRFRLDFYPSFKRPVSLLIENGLARKGKDRFALTLDGALLLDSAAGLFVEEAEKFD
ncbi:Oxygen-independent coproporphyrinogen-III oxidase-like protein [Candidatus Desulfarcum epimagneticum]|uniref:Heme chaperone HemW n=1 Tax=uncultured Desulfobacteraceae bacterium TaxID=218296 RepID=A0A484HEW1_9BACT|nr:Oxygen-independent coproporphyrinogen-III oxidase-like protein [uncultured Desulfobacteraceae bacterium]